MPRRPLGQPPKVLGTRLAYGALRQAWGGSGAWWAAPTAYLVLVVMVMVVVVMLMLMLLLWRWRLRRLLVAS